MPWFEQAVGKRTFLPSEGQRAKGNERDPVYAISLHVSAERPVGKSQIQQPGRGEAEPLSGDGAGSMDTL